MDRSQLPALTSTTMLVQAALSTPISARAKQSIKARNTVLVGGILTMVAANAAFALIPAVWGALTLPCDVLKVCNHGEVLEHHNAEPQN